MSPEISERSFEEAIECGLLQNGPDACPGDATAVRETPPAYGAAPPGGYRKRRPEDYDRTLCLLSRGVANKFQTGLDQPLLQTMYVDRKLGGVNAVQTLSRLNRTHPEKKGALVLDFANEADEIKASFEPYHETTLLSEATRTCSTRSRRASPPSRSTPRPTWTTPGRAAPRGAAEHRHGVVPDQADRQRPDRPRAQARRPRAGEHEAGPRHHAGGAGGTLPHHRRAERALRAEPGPRAPRTLGQMMEKLDEDAALDASARVNTRENVRLTFDQKVEDVIQEIVDSNFNLYKRITDDRSSARRARGSSSGPDFLHGKRSAIERKRPLMP